MQSADDRRRRFPSNHAGQSFPQVTWRQKGAHDWPVNTLYNISANLVASGDDQGVVKVSAVVAALALVSLSALGRLSRSALIPTEVSTLIRS